MQEKIPKNSYTYIYYIRTINPLSCPKNISIANCLSSSVVPFLAQKKLDKVIKKFANLILLSLLCTRNQVRNST